MLGARVLAKLTLCLLIVTFASASAIMTVRASVDNITLFGSASKGWGFTPQSMSSPGPTITVAQNDLVNITLNSADGLEHQFFVDYNGYGMQDSVRPTSAIFTNTTTLTFNATVAGTYRYYCSFHPSVMHGTFTVTSSSTQLAMSTLSPIAFLALATAAAVLLAIATTFAILGGSNHTKHRKRPTRTET